MDELVTPDAADLQNQFVCGGDFILNLKVLKSFLLGKEERLTSEKQVLTFVP
jgi:hypothetical protein